MVVWLNEGEQERKPRGDEQACRPAGKQDRAVASSRGEGNESRGEEQGERSLWWAVKRATHSRGGFAAACQGVASRPDRPFPSAQCFL